jgi:hypothetical protein
MPAFKETPRRILRHRQDRLPRQPRRQRRVRRPNVPEGSPRSATDPDPRTTPRYRHCTNFAEPGNRPITAHMSSFETWQVGQSFDCVGRIALTALFSSTEGAGPAGPVTKSDTDLPDIPDNGKYDRSWLPPHGHHRVTGADGRSRGWGDPASGRI